MSLKTKVRWVLARIVGNLTDCISVLWLLGMHALTLRLALVLLSLSIGGIPLRASGTLPSQSGQSSFSASGSVMVPQGVSVLQNEVPGSSNPDWYGPLEGGRDGAEPVLIPTRTANRYSGPPTNNSGQSWRATRYGESYEGLPLGCGAMPSLSREGWGLDDESRPRDSLGDVLPMPAAIERGAMPAPRGQTGVPLGPGSPYEGLVPPVRDVSVQPAAIERGAYHPDACDWGFVIGRYDWSVEAAMSVLLCESEGDSNAYNAGNYGLFQINALHAWRVGGDLNVLFDPATNVRVAWEIYQDNAGWGPWGCKP